VIPDGIYVEPVLVVDEEASAVTEVVALDGVDDLLVIVVIDESGVFVVVGVVPDGVYVEPVLLVNE